MHYPPLWAASSLNIITNCIEYIDSLVTYMYRDTYFYYHRVPLYIQPILEEIVFISPDARMCTFIIHWRQAVACVTIKNNANLW